VSDEFQKGLAACMNLEAWSKGTRMRMRMRRREEKPKERKKARGTAFLS